MRVAKLKTILFAGALGMISSNFAHAQDGAHQSDLMIVLDGSGSMWGQIDERTKIEIARETLSQVLEEATTEMNIGMIAYGHRERGACGDIELLVPVTPAAQSVSQIISAASNLQPKGKTPLSDAVRMAAETMRYTENAATVVLVTDGIETCNADPCALASELEAAGIDFTTHVVGFGLSADEGQQVQCLADITGGAYFSASDAGGLQDALTRAITRPEIAMDDSDFTSIGPEPRNVEFFIRDTANDPILGIRELTIAITRADGTPVARDNYSLNYPEASDLSATASLPPGQYTAAITRIGIYEASVTFDVPAGTGTHLVDLSLSARLVINTFLNPALPLDTGNPPASSVKADAWSYYEIYAINDGDIAETPLFEAYQDLDFALPAGVYLIRANLDRTTSAEKIVTVAPDGITEVDFSFDVTRVFVEALQTNGQPVERQTTYFYDNVPAGRNYFVSGGGIASDGNATPFYLPVGRFALNVGGEGYGARRSELIVDVPGDYADIRLTVGEGATLSTDEIAFLTSPAHQPCAAFLSVKYAGCLMGPLP
jgi:Mg-chelatase subunit ChlD